MLLLLLACGTDVQVAPHPKEESAQERLGLTDSQVRQILAFLQSCETTFDILDGAVGLDRDAATNLIEFRDAGDQTCGTADDGKYKTLDDVDAITQVGDQTMLDILSYVEGGADGVGEWEGVEFTADEQVSALDIANNATEAQLHDEAGLAADEAANIVNTRWIDSMDELANVSQIGPSAMQNIKDYIPTWNE